MTPALSGTTSRRIFFRRARSVSGSLRLMPGHRGVRHVDEVAARQRDLRGEARALVADRVLRHLDEDRLARAQGVLDALGLAGLETRGIPVDLAGVEHGVAALADVDEGRLHRGQDVLHPAEVDVAGHRDVGRLVDVVLHEHAVLEHAHLGAALPVAHDHDAVDGLAAGEELGLGDDGAAATGLPALAATLLLGLETGRALDAGRLVADGARLADPGRHAGRVVAGVGRRPGAAAPTAAPARGALVVAGVGPVTLLAVLVVLVVLAGGLGVVRGSAASVGAASSPESSSRSDEPRPRRPLSVADASSSTSSRITRPAALPLPLAPRRSWRRPRVASSSSASGAACGSGVGVLGSGPRCGPRAASASTGASARGRRARPTGVTGPASRTAERRRRVGVGSGAWKSRLRLGTAGPATVPRGGLVVASSSSVDRRRRRRWSRRRGVELRARVDVARLVARLRSARSARAPALLRHQLLEGRGGALGRLGRLGRGLRPRGALARRPLGSLLGGRGGGLAALARQPRSEPGLGRGGRLGVRGCRASRRQGRARPPGPRRPSSSCAWQWRACAACVSWRAGAGVAAVSAACSPASPAERSEERRVRRCRSRWVWCRWVPSGSLPSGAV